MGSCTSNIRVLYHRSCAHATGLVRGGMGQHHENKPEGELAGIEVCLHANA